MKGDVEFSELWKTVTDLKYGFNDFKGTIHEDLMIELLDKNGFVNVSGIKQDKKTDLYELKHLMNPGDNITSLGFQNGTYIYQPYGTHGAPDFVVFVHDTYLMIELKASKDQKIQWNTHIPQKNWIYIFSSRKLSDTTYFMGEEVMSDEFRVEFEKKQKQEKEERKRDKEKYLQMPGNTAKIFNYHRPMFISDEKFITSPLRNAREDRVNEFIFTHVLFELSTYGE